MNSGMEFPLTVMFPGGRVSHGARLSRQSTAGDENPFVITICRKRGRATIEEHDMSESVRRFCARCASLLNPVSGGMIE